MDFALNFNAYGWVYGSDPVVTDTNPNSADLTIPPVPEASTLILFGSGLVGLLGFVRRKTRLVKGGS